MDAKLSAHDRPGPALRRERLARRSVPGRTYVLGIGTLYRRPVFEDEAAARAVSRVHLARWAWRDAHLLAWVLLPDRWAALLTLGERDTLSTLVGRFKALSSRAVEDRHRVNGWLWGRGFSDRLLDEREDAGVAASILVDEPRRLGLVHRIGDYAYWNSAWLPPAEPGDG